LTLLEAPSNWRFLSGREASMRNLLRTAAVALVLLAVADSAHAAPNCGGGFEQWLVRFKQEAAAAGISQRTINVALAGVRFDQKIVNRDRAQGVFSQTFLEFAGRMVAGYRLQQGAAELKKNAATFARIEKDFGVPGPVIVAFWGLETDFGANMGDFSTLNALATLAYDCRRPEKFRAQLLDALRIIDAGDLRADQMRGAWAGELGQVQFMPTDYLRSGVDYDGDGRRDLIRSKPDALASSASLLAHYGWQRGEPWLQEVKVPPNLPWEEAGLDIKHTRAEWARAGVVYANGKPLPADRMPATLLLPMGRKGPAFLAYRNFDVYLEWNQSLVYATTAAYFATRLAGAPPVTKGSPVDSLSGAETKELQRILSKMGFDVGKTDGIIGEKTRESVRAVQLKYGLPPDSYPTKELLTRLRAG
jgi:lytic murein transglycosylase